MALLKSQSTPTERRSDAGGDRRNPAQQLLDENAGVRRRAAQMLAADLSSTGLLVTQLAQENSLGVRAAIMDALIAQRTEAVVDGLLPLLRSESASLRNAVIEALQQMPEQVGPKIDLLLADDNPNVRIFTVNVLESLRHASVSTWLVGVLERDPHVNVCAAAIDLLGEVGDHTAIPALQAVKRRFPDEPFIQFSASVALGQIE